MTSPVAGTSRRQRFRITDTTVVAIHSELRPSTSTLVQLDTVVLRDSLTAAVQHQLNVIAECLAWAEPGAGPCARCDTAGARIAAYREQLARLEVPR